MSSVIAQRYARALMNQAQKIDQIDAIAQTLTQLGSVLEAQPRLARLLAEPQIRTEEKTKLNQTLLVETQAPPLVHTFLAFLLKKKRQTLLPQIAQAFEALANAHMGRGKATVTVAEPLDPAQEKALALALGKRSGKTIEMEVQIDPEILGGVIAQIGTHVYDGSLRNRLHHLHHVIKKG